MKNQSRKSLVFTALFCLLGLMTGCGRAVISTEIQSDGTWKRVVKLYGVAPDGTPLGGGAGGVMTLDKTFLLPSGAGWKTTRKIEKSEAKAKNGAENPFDGKSEVYTAERTLNAGASLDHDVAIKSGDANVTAPVEVNTVSVKRLSPTRLEYVEVIKWKGGKPTAANFAEMPITDKRSLDSLKLLLPANLQTPAYLTKLQKNVSKEVWHLLFGPGDPLFSEIFQMMFLPDSVERKLRRQMYDTFDRALQETYGAELTQDQRRSIVRKIAAEQVKEFKSSAEKTKADAPGLMNGGGGKDSSLANLTVLTFSVKVPGKVVETNGEYDPVTNEVYWSFYSPAPMMGDVVLRVVCETGDQK